MVLLWPLRECSHSEGFCDIAIHDAHGNRVVRLSSVVLAGFADGREDFLGDPLTERLRGWSMSTQEHIVDLTLGEKHRGRADRVASDVFRETNLFLTDQTRELPPSVVILAGLIDCVCRVLQASGTGHRSRHEQKVMLRVAHEDIQLDAHEIALFKAEQSSAPQPFWSTGSLVSFSLTNLSGLQGFTDENAFTRASWSVPTGTL